MPTVADLTASLERIAPLTLAAEWDNVGLLLGDPAAPVARVLTCLTITPEVVDEAVREAVNLIVTHHPILFRGVKRLATTTPEGRAVHALIAAGIAVYSPHTAYDNAPGGINDLLCRKLGLAAPAPLRPAAGEPQCKLVVFVPDADLARVQDAVFAAGAGRIGEYIECSFRIPGKGTFFATEKTNPTVGQKGRREDVDEWRLEVVVPERLVPAVVRAMRQAHSYEEPAFDVYPLRPEERGGAGRIGELEQPTTLSGWAERVKRELGAASVQIVGDPGRPVRRVAVACGAAGEFLTDAVRAQADVLLTGELRFHDALAARAAGLAAVIPGHYATERPGVEDLATRLAADWPGLTVWASRAERDPFAPAG